MSPIAKCPGLWMPARERKGGRRRGEKEGGSEGKGGGIEGGKKIDEEGVIEEGRDKKR